MDAVCGVAAASSEENSSSSHLLIRSASSLAFARLLLYSKMERRMPDLPSRLRFVTPGVPPEL